MSKNWNRTIRADNGYTCYVSKCSRNDLPETCDSRYTSNYDTFYRVQNYSYRGCDLLYLAKGHFDAPKQIVAFYRNGAFWEGYRNNINDAINAAISDGWISATRPADIPRQPPAATNTSSPDDENATLDYGPEDGGGY